MSKNKTVDRIEVGLKVLVKTMNQSVQMMSSLTGQLRPIQLDPMQQEQEHPVQFKRVKEKKQESRSQHKSFTSKHSQAKKKLK